MKLDTGYHWYAIYTRPNCEKRLANDFKEKGYESFLPLQKTIRQWSDRKKLIEIPLFPNYLFLKTTSRFKYDILNVRGVVNFVEYNRQMAAIPENEIDNLRLTLKGNPEVTNQHFREGERVVVTSGPLVGLFGLLVKRKGKSRMAIRVELINKSILIDVAPNCIEKQEMVV